MWSRSSDLCLPSTRPTCLTISSALSKVCQAVQFWWNFIDFVLRYSSAQCYSAWPYIVRPSYSFCPSIVFARLSNSIFSCPVACALDFTFQFDWWLDRDAFCIYIYMLDLYINIFVYIHVFVYREAWLNTTLSATTLQSPILVNTTALTWFCSLVEVDINMFSTI